MFASIGLTISGFVFTTVITIVYFIKKKYSNVENNIYRFLLLWTLFLLILEFVCVYTMANRNIIPIINELLCRGFILGCIIWFVSIILYMRCVVSDKKYNNFDEVFGEKNAIFILVTSSVLFFISCFFDVSYTSGPDNNFYVIGGKAVYVLYVVFAFVGVYMLKVLFKNFSKDMLMKKMPILMFLVFYFILGVIQLLYADLNDLTFLFSFCVVSMYFTLENQDIKLAGELKVAKAEAEKADLAKTEFLSKMSHEIRTPMNTIMGFSEALMNKKDVTESEIKTDVKNIYNAGKSLLEIINNILIFSRIESGKENVEHTEYSIFDITNELESFVLSKIDKNNVKFSINIDPKISANYIGDKLKVYRILLNIVSNSTKFTSSGEISLNISCNNKDNIGRLKFEIVDTGFGMKKEELDKLMLNFSDNTDISSNLSGTGLGLVVVKRIIDMMDGSIAFESEYGIGTKFFVELEQGISGKDKVGDLKKIKSIKKEKEYFDCSKYSILIVDDNKLNRKVTERLLKPYNIKIDTADNGSECIEKIKSGYKYDIIFLDHLMPELDGIETIRILKKLELKELPPIVAMTANVVTEVKDTYIKEGFSDYLAKPVDIKDLNKLLKKYFMKRGAK
ncbi:MAG: response regulator [bacterium]|nr:response regulator [bacterium]